MIYPKILTKIHQVVHYFDTIPAERKRLLSHLADYICKKQSNDELCRLIYICTHNSRRSHFGQIWAQVAASYFHLNNVQTFSGGTESTAFNPNAIHALRNTGFDIVTRQNDTNPTYEVRFGDHEPIITCFSKKYDDISNPTSNFCAVMVCGHADVNCPFVPGAELRIATPYEDPKNHDGTPNQENAYLACSTLIATETFYAFSLAKKKYFLKNIFTF